MKNSTLIILALALGTSVLAQKPAPKPAAKATAPVKLDRSKRPSSAAAPQIKIGESQMFTLENGMKVFVVENHKLPKLSVSIQLDVDPMLEKDNVGLEDMVGQLLESGTKSRSKDKLDEEIDHMGGSLNAGGEGIYGSALKKHQEKLMELLSDVTLNSDFKQEELDKIKTQTLSGLASSKDNPDNIANNVENALIYGDNHPYGEITTETTVNNITLDKCKMYYRTFFRPNIAYMAFVGDISAAEAKVLAQKYFGSWENAPVPTAKYDLPKEPGGARVAVVNKAGAVQTVLSVAYAMDLKPNAEDLVKAKVLNTILGGGATGRLFLNLREKHGWTYGSYSHINDDEFAGSFSAGAKVRNAVTDSAVTEILAEMKRLRSEKISIEELQNIKNQMIGNFAISLESPQTVAGMAINIERKQLAKDYYTNYLKNIAAITPDDILATAQKYLKPANCWILAVGNKDEISEKLKVFATSGKVEYFDTYGKPEKAAKTIPAGTTAESVMAKYTEALGGAKNIAKVKDFTQKMSASMQGMNIEMTTQRKAPNKFAMSLTMQTMVLQKQVFDGKRAKSSSMQGSEELKGDDLKALALQSNLFADTRYKELGYKTELKAIEEVNGKDAFVIEVTDPMDNKEAEYYDVASGLKVKSVKTEESPQGPV